jgi:hypothetical protein
VLYIQAAREELSESSIPKYHVKDRVVYMQEGYDDETED